MKSYKCDVCGKEINSWNTNIRVCVFGEVIEKDLCDEHKEKIRKKISIYEKRREKLDIEFINSLFKKEKKCELSRL